MFLNKLLIFVLALGAIVLCPCQAAPPPNTVVGDTFTLDAGKRKAGKQLERLPSEIGQVPWIATDHLIFTDRGTITSNTVNPVVGSLLLPAFSKALTLQADFILEGSGWVSLSLGNKGDPNSFWNATKILATLSKSGHYAVFADGIKTKLADGTLKSTPLAGQMNHLELSYDPTGNKVSFVVNGERAADQVSLGQYMPLITYASFRFENPVIVNTPEVTNFFVSIEK